MGGKVEDCLGKREESERASASGCGALFGCSFSVWNLFELSPVPEGPIDSAHKHPVKPGEIKTFLMN
jgi:hypothetical protein